MGRKDATMQVSEIIESAIRAELSHRCSCTLQVLIDRLPQFSWSGILSVVDHLSRKGTLILRHPTRFDYEVSLSQGSPVSGSALPRGRR